MADANASAEPATPAPASAPGSAAASAPPGSSDGRATEETTAVEANEGQGTSGRASVASRASRPASRRSGDVATNGAASVASGGAGETGAGAAASTTLEPAEDPRNMRRIIAEDPEWSLATVPLLVDVVVNHIVDNFEFNPLLDELPPKHRVKVLERISTNLPLKVTANLVADEGYWRRRCRSRWEICDVSAFAESWKRMFFERHIQDLIENFVPDATDPAQLNEALQLSKNFVRRLDVGQMLPPERKPEATPPPPEVDAGSETGSESGEAEGPALDHFDFNPVVKELPYLEELRVNYGVKNCGMNFDWNLFNFSLQDCMLLSKCVASCSTIKSLSVHRSKVDDDRLRFLVSNLVEHPSLEALDVGHNVLGDRSARALGKLLNGRTRLRKIDLCNNQIGLDGARALAHALTKNSTLEDLNLRLNCLGDEGGSAICGSLLKNSTLKVLNLSCNDMTEPVASVLANVVIHNSSLESINLSCNKLGPDGGKQLQEGMAENQTIKNMDLRLTDCGQESEYCVNEILKKNRERRRDTPTSRQIGGGASSGGGGAGGAVTSAVNGAASRASLASRGVAGNVNGVKKSETEEVEAGGA